MYMYMYRCMPIIVFNVLLILIIFYICQGCGQEYKSFLGFKYHMENGHMVIDS